MRLIGMALALGAIVWVMLQAAGGGDAESVISEGQQQALIKAQGMEQSLQKAAAQRLQEVDALE